MENKKIIKEFEKRGYQITRKLYFCDGVELKGKNIIILISGPKKHKSQTYFRKIRAESADTFNKWNQAYYVNDLPKTDDELKEIFSHLEILNNKEHTERANEFKTFFEK